MAQTLDKAEFGSSGLREFAPLWRINFSSHYPELKKGANLIDSSLLFVPKVGLEPTRCCQHWILSPACLPIPPLWQADTKVFNFYNIENRHPISLMNSSRAVMPCYLSNFYTPL